MKKNNPRFTDHFRSQEAVVFVITVIIFGSFSIFLKGFFDVENLLTLVRSVSVLGILSIAMAIVVISRGIDLSLVGVLVVSTALAVILTSPNSVFPKRIVLQLGGPSRSSICNYCELHNWCSNSIWEPSRSVRFASNG